MGRKTIYEFGSFWLEPDEHRVKKDGEAIGLSPQLFDLLVALLENAGHLSTKKELQKRIWGERRLGVDNALKTIVGDLREILGDDADEPIFIETVRGKGYRFIAAVREIRAPEEASMRPASARTAIEQPAVTLGTRRNEHGPAAVTLGTEKIDDTVVPDRGPATVASIATTETTTAHVEVPAKEASARVELTSQSNKSRFRNLSRILALAALALFAAAILGAVIPQAPPTITGYKPLTHGGHEIGEVLPTDGVRVYFQEAAGAKQLIGAVPVSGSGSPGYLNTPFGIPVLYAMFPRGEALLVGDGSSESNFWRLPVVGGAAQPLPKMHGEGIALSPDGGRYVRIEAGRTLAVAEVDGTDARTVFSASDSMLPFLASWSPDGKRICFTRLNPEAGKGADVFSIWSVDANGSNLRELVPPQAEIRNFSFCNWTPDGKYLLYSAVSHGKSDLWALQEQTWWNPFAHPKPVRLTNNPVEFYQAVATPDGKKIVALGRVQRAELVRYDMKTNAWLPFLDGLPAEHVDISRDGEWITYVNFADKTLWRSRIDGSEPKQLTFAPTIAETPHWSPDGMRIALRLTESGRPAEVHLISRDGGVPQPLIPGDTEEEGTPTWSADGKQIMFGRLRYRPEKIEVSIMDLESGKLETVPGSRGLWSPRWSPSGRYLMAMSAGGAYFNSKSLLVFDFRTKKWKKLLDNNALEEPVWSHDERYIYFVAATPERVLFRVSMKDRKLERIVSLAGFPELGTWLGMTPDDSPVLVRDVRLIDLYALDVKW